MAPPTAEYLILDLLCPSLGVILTTLTFAAPIQSLRERLALANNAAANNNNRGCSLGLGDLNPLPWAVMTGNCWGWIAYSYLTRDLFVLMANVPGLMVSVWLNLGAIKLQYLQQHRAQYCERHGSSSSTSRLRHRVHGGNAANANGRGVLASSSSPTPTHAGGNGVDTSANASRQDHNYDYDYGVETIETMASTPATVPHEQTVLWVLFFWVAVCSLVAHVRSFTNYEREQIIGYIVNLNLCFFYFAPLTTIVEVCRMQSSASIHRATTMMTVTNCFFWFVYGLAVRDPFIFVPNGVGGCFGIVQALLLCMFPSKRGANANANANGQDDARETLIPENGSMVEDGGNAGYADGVADRFDNGGIENSDGLV